MSYPFTLKHALTLNFLLVAAVPVLLLGLLNIQIVSEHQLKDVGERNMLLAGSLAEEVETFLLEAQSDLRLVEQTALHGTVVQPAALDDFLAGLVTNSELFESIYLLDDQLKVLHLGILPGKAASRDNSLRLDFSGHRLFQGRQKISGAHWSGMFLSPVTGEPTVELALPLPDGFLIGNIRLSNLTRLLRRYSNPGGIEISIIDDHGGVVAHNLTPLAKEQLDFFEHPVVALALAGESTTGEFRQGDRFTLESAAGVPSAAWIVWVGLDMHQVLAPLHEMRNLLAGFMLVVIVLACFIALINVRRLMQPLTALGQRAGRIADGHYDFNFSPSGFSEIDLLGRQITSMTEAIKIREESIVTNEQRFRGLVNSIDGVVWEMEYPSFRILFVSEQAVAMLGYPIHDWYTVPSFWEDRTYVEDIAQAKAYCQLMVEKRTDHNFECRMTSAEGRTVWVRNLVTVVVEEDRPVRLIGVMIDITAHKKLLEDLSRSEEKYREIFNATKDAILIHDAGNGEVLDVNQAMLEMFGCSHEEALSGGVKAISAGTRPFDLAGAKKKLNQAMEEGSCAFEWRARRKNGELFWVDVSLHRAEIGQQRRILASVRDISDRKVAAEQLKEANERLLLLIDCMPLGCILLTPDLKVSMWNPAAESIFGFCSAEMVGHTPFSSIVVASERPVAEESWARMMAGEVVARSVSENITRDGRTITCEWSNTPVTDQLGETIGVISMVQDVSARKAAEDELTRYRVHLEDLVRERTGQLELAQQELVQKERLAVLGQLTATVSHEIRNPLGTVANAIYVLKEQLKAGDQASLERSLLLAERNVERCDDIISDLLDFSRRRSMQKKALQIDPWFDELLDELSIPKEINCRRELNSQATVSADPERLRRVMVNVVTNALQALAERQNGDQSLSAETRSRDDRCEIVVSDNGSGMSAEVLARIFEPMFSTKNFGVGLGVPIIKNILEGHGGGVDYQSVAGEGTTVVMWLPLLKDGAG